MSQSRMGSFAEVVVSTCVGLGLAFSVQGYLYVLYGIEVSPGQNFQMTMWMTALSTCRGYVLRRMFNGSVWKKLVRPVPFRVCRDMFRIEGGPDTAVLFITPKARKRLQHVKTQCCYTADDSSVEIQGSVGPLRFFWWSVLGIVEGRDV